VTNYHLQVWGAEWGNNISLNKTVLLYAYFDVFRNLASFRGPSQYKDVVLSVYSHYKDKTTSRPLLHGNGPSVLVVASLDICDIAIYRILFTVLLCVLLWGVI